MNLLTILLFGVFGCLLGIVILALFAIRTEDEVPLFVYGAGLVLVVAGLIFMVDVEHFANCTNPPTAPSTQAPR